MPLCHWIWSFCVTRLPQKSLLSTSDIQKSTNTKLWRNWNVWVYYIVFWLISSSCHHLHSTEDSGREERSFSVPLQWSNNLHHSQEEVWLIKTQFHEPVREWREATLPLLQSGLPVASELQDCSNIYHCFCSNMFSFVCCLSDIQQQVQLTPPVNTSSSGSFLWRMWRWWKVRPSGFKITAGSFLNFFRELENLHRLLLSYSKPFPQVLFRQQTGRASRRWSVD